MQTTDLNIQCIVTIHIIDPNNASVTYGLTLRKFHNIKYDYKWIKKYNVLFIDKFKMITIGKMLWYERNAALLASCWVSPYYYYFPLTAKPQVFYSSIWKALQN